LVHDAFDRAFGQILLRMRNRDALPRFVRMLELVVAAPNPNKLPTIIAEPLYNSPTIHASDYMSKFQP
jgi:hypothetical protein